MSRFYVPSEYIKGKEITISGKEAHHILDVMRLKTLDKVVLFDGTGKEYVGVVTEVHRKSLSVEIIETRKSACLEKYRITLIQAIPKKDKMDYIVEKATELGVSSIIPVLTERSIPDWDEDKKMHVVMRWQKIAREASKQCGRVSLPDVHPIHYFKDTLRSSKRYDSALIAALTDDSVRLKDAINDFKGNDIAIAIGPEGDFTPDEIRSAQDTRFKVVSLGPRVLKSDTAGLAVLSVLNYELER